MILLGTKNLWKQTAIDWERLLIYIPILNALWMLMQSLLATSTIQIVSLFPYLELP